jgi:CBS domain-containing protein
MATRAVGMLLVLDQGRRPVGVVTDRDLALRVIGDGRDPGSVTVGDVMTRSPKTVSEIAAVEDALALMRTHAVRRLPVVSPQGDLVGVVSLDDILALLADELWQMRRVIKKSSPQALSTP